MIRGYTTRKGIDQDMVYRTLWWCIAAGLIGGRLYFVIQQPNFVSYYLANPLHIIATWEGGMAFFGALFLSIPTLIWRARVERVNPLVLIDAGVLFAAAGQIFGRIGNLINGDIVGYPSTLPWSTVYTHPASWACLPGSTICNVPVQPAAGYELLTNVVLLLVMLYLARRVTKPGVLMLVYLFAYAITQFFLFFVRDNIYVKLFGVIDWHLKQAQWTSLFLLIVLIPITYLVVRYSKPVPRGEVAATYGVEQKPVEGDKLAKKTLDGEVVKVEDGEIKHIDSSQLPSQDSTVAVNDADATPPMQAGQTDADEPALNADQQTSPERKEPEATPSTLPSAATDEAPLSEATPDVQPEATANGATPTTDAPGEQTAEVENDEHPHSESTLDEQVVEGDEKSGLSEDTHPKTPAIRRDETGQGAGSKEPADAEDTTQQTDKEEDRATKGR